MTRSLALLVLLACTVACVSGGGDTTPVVDARVDGTVGPSVDGGRDVSLIFDVDDPTTCGSCPKSAPACMGGACVCPSGATVCDGECVDLGADPRHCTACGMACGAEQFCRTKAMPPCKCRAPAVACAGKCIHRQTDPTGCGECDFVCPKACARGACVETCPPDLTACPWASKTACVDLARDPAHCGACGIVCGHEEVCAAGKCVTYRPAVGCATCPCTVCATALPGSTCCPGLPDHLHAICVRGTACP